MKRNLQIPFVFLRFALGVHLLNFLNMNSRRNFIKQSATALLGTAAISSLPIQSFASQVKILSLQPDDEEYWKLLRTQFPLTHERVYFNNGTMGPSPYPVIDMLRKTILDVDTGGEYGGWDSSRAKLAKFVNVREDEISLTHNVTDGINVVCWGLPLKKGDEVIVSDHEHVGNALPWLNRQRVHGIKVKYCKLGTTADETLNNLKQSITKKTRVIAIPHIVCTIGQIQPIKEMVQLGKERGIFVFVDGAHGPGMLDLDLKDLACDFYATCCHKWMLGPKGTGFLYVRKEMQDILQPYFVGGGSDSGWNILGDKTEMKGYANSAHRYDGGTQSTALYAGVNAAIDFIEQIGKRTIETRVLKLGKYFQQSLLDLKSPNLEILTSTEDRSRGGVNAFRLKNMDYQKFGEFASKKNFRIRLVPENGVNCARVSTHIYNNFEEIDRFVQMMKEVV